MREGHLVVTRTARFAVLGEHVARPAEVWFVLHGFGMLASSFLAAFQPLADRTRRIYAPEALNRYYLDGDGVQHGPESRVGATWMTREDRLVEIADYVRYLDTLYRHVFAELPRAEVRAMVLGFSQGAATAARWAATGNAALDGVILWGSPAPPDLDLAQAARRWVGTPLTLVYGRLDRYFDEARAVAEAERLRTAGITPELVSYDGGHRIDAETLLRLAPTR